MHFTKQKKNQRLDVIWEIVFGNKVCISQWFCRKQKPKAKMQIAAKSSCEKRRAKCSVPAIYTNAENSRPTTLPFPGISC